MSTPEDLARQASFGGSPAAPQQPVAARPVTAARQSIASGQPAAARLLSTCQLATGLLAAMLVPAHPAAAQQAPDPSAYTALEWRHIGPEGNRFSAAAGIVGDRHTYYVGAASGGIYKTTDGGVHWDAIFDEQPVQSIGSLGVATADPNIVGRSGAMSRWDRGSTSPPTPVRPGR